MSAFSDLILKSHARWTTLVEMGLGRVQDLWINETAGIWQYPFTTDWSNLPVLLGFDMPSGETAIGAGTVPEINTVKQGTEFLTLQASYASMISTNKSYYYNASTNTLYVHCDGGADPDVYVMILGTTYFAADRAVDLDGHYWEPCIAGTPTMELTRDPLLYGIMAFDGGQVTLDNHGGRLDSFKDCFLYGQPITIKFGGDDLAYADFRTCFRGFIQNVTLGEEEINIDAIDKRYELGLKIPPNRYTVASYPDINYKNVGKPIPLAWGTCKNVPCVCTNEGEAAPSNYTFKVCDVADHTGGIQGITAAYVNGESKAISSYSLIAGTFNIASANYAPGRLVSADIIGYGTKNLLIRSDCESATGPAILDETSNNLTYMTFARSTDFAYAGTYSYKATKTIAAPTQGSVYFQDTLNTTDMHGLSVNTTVTLSLWVYVPSASGISLSEIFLQIGDYQAGWDLSTSSSPANFDVWQQITVTRTIRASATGILLEIVAATTAAINEYFYIDNVQLELAGSATSWILREDPSLSNSLSVIEDITNTYTDIAYSSTYFDTTEWEAEKAGAFTIGLFVEDEKEISEIVADIAKTNAANFIAKDDGLYTWKKWSDAGSASWTAAAEETENAVSSDQDYDNYLTSVHVGYSRDWDKNKTSVKGKTDLETTIYQKYGQYRDYSLDTFLTTEAAAETLAAWLMDYMKDSRQIIENDLPIKYIETEIGDVVELNGDRASGIWMGPVRCEVIGVKKQLGDEPKVTITGREVPV
jgi:hypothetical protein